MNWTSVLLAVASLVPRASCAADAEADGDAGAKPERTRPPARRPLDEAFASTTKELADALAEQGIESVEVLLPESPQMNGSAWLVQRTIERLLLLQGIPIARGKPDARISTEYVRTSQPGRYSFTFRIRHHAGQPLGTVKRWVVVTKPVDHVDRAILEGHTFDASFDRSAGQSRLRSAAALEAAMKRAPRATIDKAHPALVRAPGSSYGLEVHGVADSSHPKFEVQGGLALFEPNRAFQVKLVNRSSRAVAVDLSIDGVNVWERAAELSEGPRPSAAKPSRLSRRKLHVPARGELLVPGWPVGSLPEPRFVPFDFSVPHAVRFGQVTAVFHVVPDRGIGTSPMRGDVRRTRARVVTRTDGAFRLEDIEYETQPIAAVSAHSIVYPPTARPIFGNVAGRFRIGGPLHVPPRQPVTFDELVDQGEIRVALDRIARAKALDDAMLKFLGRSLASEQVAVRRSAVEFVFDHEEFETILARSVLPRLRDGTDPERVRILQMFHEVPVVLLVTDESLMESVESLCRSKDEAVRVAALAAIPGLTGAHESSVRGLVKLLASDRAVTRRDAAERLGSFGRHAEPATGALLQLLNDSDETVVASAVEAIRRIGGS